MVGGITDEASPSVSSLMVMIARSWSDSSGESSRKRTVAICIQNAVHGESQERRGAGAGGSAESRNKPPRTRGVATATGRGRKGEARNLALQFDFR